MGFERPWCHMGFGRPWCHSSSMENTDVQAAINNSSRHIEDSFTMRIGKIRSHQQYIPVQFARFHKLLHVESITLEGPTGKVWSTKLRPEAKAGRRVRFGIGWRQFSVENHLQEGQQLLFTLVGRFRFLVQFFDHLGKRCTGYTPLPGTQSRTRPRVDGGKASHRPEASLRDEHRRVPTFDPRNDSPSRDDELPDMQPKKATMKRGSPVAPPVASSHKVGASSESSRALCFLQQQGCMRFSDIVLKCKRRDVSDQERLMVQMVAKRFASSLGTRKFRVLMQDAQVYQGFHMAIPEKILEATGTERASKVDVCLLDREQVLYKAHWTRKNSCKLALLDRDAWAKFAVDHTLEEGDVCVFELLPQPLQSKPAVSVATFCFLVHIFRVV